MQTMLTRLIPSRTRIKVLKLLLLNPDNSYYQREIAHLVGSPIRGVQRELERLVQIGLVEVRVRGNRKYFTTNRHFPIFNELKSILFKTVALGEVIRTALLRSPDEIRLAFIYGSYARQRETLASDIDILVVGAVAPRSLSSLLAPVKTDLGREINFSVRTVAEFRKDIRARNNFLISVLREKKIFLIGDEDTLRTITG